MDNLDIDYNLTKEWKNFLNFDFTQIFSILNKEYKEKTVYPKKKDIFRWSEFIKPDQVKVVILANEPYSNKFNNQSCGIAFCNCKSKKPSEILKNIIKVVSNNYKILPRNIEKYSLVDWIKQGVLLINIYSTVIEGCPYSHKNIGWDKFIEILLSKLSSTFPNLVFLFWGKLANSFVYCIRNKNYHLILKSCYPSNVGFLKCNHFFEANEFLKKNNKGSINFLKTFYGKDYDKHLLPFFKNEELYENDMKFLKTRVNFENDFILIKFREFDKKILNEDDLNFFLHFLNKT
jgi:uracil-DNA glycosylase